MKPEIKNFLLLLLTLSSFTFASSLDTLFMEALNESEAGNTDKAISKLENWLEEAKETQTQSSQVHHNLAALYAKKSEYSKASVSLIRATQILHSPWSRRTELLHLREVQRSLGIQHSTLENSYHLGLLTLPDTFIPAILAAITWLFFLYYYLLLVKREAYRALPTSALLLFLFSCGLWLALKTFGTLGVLNYEQEIPVYANPEMKEKIVTLPPGTLVRVRKTAAGNHQILEPVFGWIKSETCLLMERPPLLKFPS